MDAGAVEVLIDAHAGIAEGPLWDPVGRRLVWTDIPGERVHATDLGSGADTVTELDGRVGSIGLRAAGGFVYTVENDFVLSGPDPRAVERRLSVSDDPRFRFNDGKCDPAGRFFAGLIATDGRWGAAALYRLDPDLRAVEVLDGVSCSNGLGWSPDGRTMYYVDTPTYRVDRFDYDAETGSMSNRSVFAEFTDGYGRPDGLAVDAEGCVWVALWGGSEVRRFSPTGRHLESIRLPVSLVSSVAFAGDRLDVLVITSASELPRRRLEAEPLAGAIFVTAPGVPGQPVGAFAA